MDGRRITFDCTNSYFECEQEDEDIEDEVTGEVMNGLRQYGMSKEHRLNPIVEMGLFMDLIGDSHHHVPSHGQHQ